MNRWLAALTLSLQAGCGTTGDLLLGRRAASTAMPVTDAAGPARDAGPTGPGPLDATPLDAAPASETGISPCAAGAALPSPAQRFDFSGTGATVVDRAGGPSANILGGTLLDGSGGLQLDGDDDFVDLPNGLISQSPTLTIALWVSLVDGPAYWRVFDFGVGTLGEDPTEFDTGASYVAFTTETGLDPSGMALLVGHGGASAEDRAPTARIATGEMTFVAATFDALSARLYLDAELVAETPLSAPLTEINDVNNWLGRSQYAADPLYPGRYDELRLYHEQLSDCQLQTLRAWGPDRVQ